MRPLLGRSVEGIRSEPGGLRWSAVAGAAGIVPIGLVLVASVVCVPASVVAQDAGAPTRSGVTAGDTLDLTLEEAMDRAEANNPGLRQTTNDLELNAIERREAWLGVLPSPSLQLLRTSQSWNRTTIAEDNFGEPLPREQVDWAHFSRSSQSTGLNFTLNLEDWMAFRANGEEAVAREEAVREERHGLRADLREAFLDLQEQQAAIRLEEELLEAARVNRDLAERLYALNQRDRMDLLQLELDLADQEATLDQNRDGLELARLELRNLIGDPGLGPFRAVPVELTDFEPEGLDVEALVQVARAESPQVRQPEANLRAELRTLSTSRLARWLPTLDVNWSATRQAFVRGSDAFFEVNPDGGWDQQVGLILTLPPLGQYFNQQTQQRRTELQIRNQRESLRSLRGDLEVDVRTQVNTLRSAARALTRETRRAELAEQHLELSREQYGLGGQTYLELVNAQEQAATARRGILTARYEFERARIALERATGMTVEEMLELSGGL